MIIRPRLFEFRTLKYPSRETKLTEAGVQHFSNWFSKQTKAIETFVKKLFHHNTNKKKSRVAPCSLYIQGVSFKRGKPKQRIDRCKQGFRR